MACVLPFTGEQMVPEQAVAHTFWAHIYRYRFAASFVGARSVLDLACGEGYGTASLAQAHAEWVVGLDLSTNACIHARRKYGERFAASRAEVLPFRNNTFGVVVSFETIEHLEAPEVFLDECARVLRPQGVLVISTPNREVYREAVGVNPYHVREYAPDEFLGVIRERFRRVRLHAQCPRTAGWWHPRSLAAQESVWQRIRGYHRFHDFLVRAFCRYDPSEVTEQMRRGIVDTVLRRDRMLAFLFNRYAVRPWSSTARERPWYMVVVAQL
jgi:SAM-dependent methyltransferase